MTAFFHAYGASDTGRVRPTNEDCFAVHDDLALCVVADGMGGHNAGEVAARLAVDTVVEYLRSASRRSVGPPAHLSRKADSAVDTAIVPPGPKPSDEQFPYGYDESLSLNANLLRTAVQVANAAILDASAATTEYSGMGTTVVVSRVADGRLAVAHVGDSRLYVLAAGRLRLLTQDDSWMADVLAHDPQADPVVLANHPMRSVLTNVVGARPYTDVHVTELPIGVGDSVLVTTDGIHGVLDDRDLERLMVEGRDPREIATRMIAAALDAGSRDNCTVVVGQYGR